MTRKAVLGFAGMLAISGAAVLTVVFLFFPSIPSGHSKSAPAVAIDSSKEVLGMEATSSFSGIPTATSSFSIIPGRLRVIRDPIVKKGERSVRVPVLMYHYVRELTPGMSTSSRWLSVSPDHFRAQMQEIIDGGYHAITPDDLDAAINGKMELPANPVLVTFDDGYRDQYDAAFPILKQLNIKATFFIITGYINHGSLVYMTPGMIKALDSSGLITVGAHTRHHPELAKLKPTEQHDEIVGSKMDLEKLLGHPVTAFAYPYGNFDEAVKNIVSGGGFHTAFSTLLGSVHTSSSRLELRRIRVLDDEHLAPILAKFGV